MNPVTAPHRGQSFCVPSATVRHGFETGKLFRLNRWLLGTPVPRRAELYPQRLTG
jgi:hypothetical protein